MPGTALACAQRNSPEMVGIRRVRLRYTETHSNLTRNMNNKTKTGEMKPHVYIPINTIYTKNMMFVNPSLFDSSCFYSFKVSDIPMLPPAKRKL